MISPDQSEKLARACASDAPGTAIDRWRALCLGALFGQLLGKGRDITMIVGKRTDRKRGEFAVVTEGERN